VTPTPRKVHFVSLGCPKNLVDGEVMQGMLVREGHELVLDPAQADVLVVNTCSFIDEAKEESIDTILELARYKEEGRASRLIVTGCLAERYGTVLRQSMPEVDVFVGTGNFLELPKLLVADAPKPTYVGAQHVLHEADAPRIQATPFYTSFLKIAEGCNRTCSFCIIPKIRGRQESRSIASLVEEAFSRAERAGYRVVTPRAPERHGPMLNIACVDAPRLVTELEQAGIVVARGGQYPVERLPRVERLEVFLQPVVAFSHSSHPTLPARS